LTLSAAVEENLLRECRQHIKKCGGDMFGLFGKKDGSGLPGPKSIPDAVGQQLVVSHKEEPDWVWTLKSVMKADEAGDKDSFRIRVFSDSMATAAKVDVRDFTTLDAYPSLILYDGVFNKKLKAAKMERRYKRS
jgi:hypothetical protein